MEILIVLLLLFLPFVVALVRGNSNAGAVLAVNLFLGWTIIGWFVAFGMALHGSKKPQQVIVVAALPTVPTVQRPEAHNDWYERWRTK